MKQITDEQILEVVPAVMRSFHQELENRDLDPDYNGHRLVGVLLRYLDLAEDIPDRIGGTK